MAIKVLHICSALNRNGTETFIMNVFRKIDRSKISFDFLVNQSSDDGFEQEARSLGANIFVLPPRREGFFRYSKALDDFFKKNGDKYKAVHLHGNSFTSLLPLKKARKYGVQTIVAHCHNMSTTGLHNRILHILNRSQVHQIANTYFACSEGARQYGFSHTRAFDESVVVPNGIELDTFKFNPDLRYRMRKELALSDRLVIGNVAALRDAKNHFFMLDVMAELVKLSREAVLLLVGDGPLRDEIMEKIQTLNLENNVRLLGSRDDVPALLQAMDIFFFPSKYEGLGISLIEAQAAGLEVIASDTIPQETAVSPLIRYLPLDLPPSEWAKVIAETERRPRNISYEGLKKFDIKDTCRILTDTYLG